MTIEYTTDKSKINYLCECGDEIYSIKREHVKDYLKAWCPNCAVCAYHNLHELWFSYDFQMGCLLNYIRKLSKKNKEFKGDMQYYVLHN